MIGYILLTIIFILGFIGGYLGYKLIKHWFDNVEE